jgi:hypothetical protein
MSLAALNVLLLVSNGFLVAVLVQTRDIRGATAIAGIAGEREALARECSKMAGQSARLAEALHKLRVLGVRPGSEPTNSQSEKSFNLQAEFPEVDLSRRPDPREIPDMEPEEIRHLDERRKRLPHELRGGVLLSGDVEQVLASILWNPDRRGLDSEERADLAQLLSDYRYYARLSQVERFKTHVEPQLERLREAGAYVEYPEGQPPPMPDGVRIGHAEPSDRKGFRRVFYFPANDYPDLAHHERVEQERGLETFLKVFDLINPTAEAK